MDPGAHAVELSARAYLAAAQDRDYDALWRLMSRAAQAIMLSTAKAEGLATDNGPAALQALMSLQATDQRAPDDVAIEVVSPTRTLPRSPSARHPNRQLCRSSTRMGTGKLGVQGLHAPKA